MGSEMCIRDSFQRAFIQVGRAAPVECDVEIDVASGGWQQHGHHTNPAFSGVGLHVVWQAGKGGPTGLPMGTHWSARPSFRRPSLLLTERGRETDRLL